MNEVLKDATSTADILVIGAGPAGMMAAIAAAQAGATVTIVDHMDRPGVKLLATGGGRCNLTNNLDADAFMARFGRQGRFLQDALAALGRDELLEMLAQLGVETYCDEEGRLYPTSDSAQTVQQAMWRRCEQLGVRAMLGVEVTRIDIPPAGATADSVIGAGTSKGLVRARCVILACGGKSYAQLGSDGSGYTLAAQAGHAIVAPTPALVGLVTREKWGSSCAGTSISQAKVWIDLPRQPKAGIVGDVLFTHTGLSGPAVLDISSDVVTLLEKAKAAQGGKGSPKAAIPIRVSPYPERSAAHWMRVFDFAQSDQGTRSVLTLLRHHLPACLAQAICELANVPLELTCAHVSRSQRESMAALLSGIPFAVVGSDGFDNSIATRGGVRLKDVDPRTMASRLAGGLYFAGEILDLDGPCGGFHLQMAFSTGYLAGTSAARKATT